MSRAEGGCNSYRRYNIHIPAQVLVYLRYFVLVMGHVS